MDGIHDLGGMHGFGPVRAVANEPVFHAPWERRVLGMVYQVVGFGWANIDAFRHGIERMDPVAYLTAGYYGRWLDALERVCTEAGLLAPGEVDRRLAGDRTPAAPGTTGRVPRPVDGFVRAVDARPRYVEGQVVRTIEAHPAGHTRLPRYARGKRGVVARVRPAFVFPDTNAGGAGEQPQYLYGLRFEARELWGADAEGGVAVHLDLFEPYLEPA